MLTFYLLAVPSKPLYLKITNMQQHSVGLSWKKPLQNGGEDIIGYNIEVINLSKKSQDWVKNNISIIKELQYETTGLQENNEYS